MDVDRLRRVTRDDLERLPDPAADTTFGTVEDALRELATTRIPSEDVIELLLSTATTAEIATDGDRVPDRIRRAVEALRAEVEPVGELLARSRRQANLSHDQVGRESGVDAQLLRQVEEDRSVARLLNVPARNVAALTRRLRIAPQVFAASLARSIPPPSSFVYGYRPRQERDTPVQHDADEGSRLVSWLNEYLRA
jgi:transcriptional regulator with XRE-family HTH domain